MRKVYPQFYGTIEHIKGHNRFKLDNPSYWEKFLDNSLKVGQRITIALKPYYKPRTTGSIKDKDEGKGNQNGYYWVVVLPILAEEWGLELQEAHKEVMLYFLPKPSKLDPNKLIGGSTTKLNRLEWEDLMERIRTWAATQDTPIKIPLPNEVIDDDEEAPIMPEAPEEEPKQKVYILKKDCPNIGKERGDYYNNEYRESIEELLAKGTIEEETEEAPVEPEKAPDPINPLIELFKAVNPSYERLYANKNQRAALERMIKKMGIPELEAIIRFLPNSNAHKHAPKITTPYNLEAKLGDLIAWANVQKKAQRKVADLGKK